MSKCGLFCWDSGKFWGGYFAALLVVGAAGCSGEDETRLSKDTVGFEDDETNQDTGLAEPPDVYGTDAGKNTSSSRFVYSTSCRLADDPGGHSNVTLVPAFPNLTFSKAVQLATPMDGTGRLFVVEQGGLIKVFSNEVAATQADVFLDVTDWTSSFGEQGLLGMAFHPRYVSNGWFYVNYTTKGDGDTVIARFEVSKDDPNKADPASQQIVLTIEQPYANHNGGQILFGPDGYLYIGMGDGGAGGDPKGHGQDTKTLLGAMLRIDVDNPQGGKPYGIPADNPFAKLDDGSKPEIFAWGLRNPWRFSFDRLTGTLWAGDVGQDNVEEVDVIELGKNYGWNTMEGTACYKPAVGCKKEGLMLPVAEYTHAEVGESITGGYVYRGKGVPSLYGSYVYGDFVTSQVLIWKVGEQSPPVAGSLKAPGNIAAFGEDEAGELFVVTYQNGIHRFVENDVQPKADDFPQLLSETGCFDDLVTMKPAAGVLPYSIQSPLWSDGARKQRYVVLPKDGTIELDPTSGRLMYPAGTMFIKHFELVTDQTSPENSTRLETRFLVLLDHGAKGYTYRWNLLETDAELLPGADVLPLTLTDDQGDVMPYAWQFPSRTQCDACHTQASGYVLGADDVGQLNRSGAGSQPQLATWAGWGLFDPSLGDGLADLPRFADPYDSSEPVENRVRSYLHSNCSGCHMPGGAVGAELDLRHDTSLGLTQLCDKPPLKGDLGIVGAKLLKPGKADESLVYVRMIHSGAYRMPPLGSSMIDEQAARLVRQWVVGQSDCTSQ
ncbi:MAG: PQQ-dependent sugar dehydrogenase [Myxococcales bacterium]|nr:PQQ-dependent sugar dehydrogenase [Myxococcales bacterium]